MANGDQAPEPIKQQDPTTGSSGKATDLLEQDIGCPTCQYNLRGLGSGDVVCPECGTVSNVAQLLTRRWNKPWYQAPKYNLLAMPAGWILVAAVGLGFAAGINDFQVGGIIPWPMMLAGWLLLSILSWVLLMLWVCKSVDGVGTIGYALLVHVALAGYLVGVPMFITGLIWLISDVIDLIQYSSNTGISLLWSILLMAGGIGLFVFGRWIERYVAGYCIKLYLRGKPA